MSDALLVNREACQPATLDAAPPVYAVAFENNLVATKSKRWR